MLSKTFLTKTPHLLRRLFRRMVQDPRRLFEGPRRSSEDNFKILRRSSGALAPFLHNCKRGLRGLGRGVPAMVAGCRDRVEVFQPGVRLMCVPTLSGCVAHLCGCGCPIVDRSNPACRLGLWRRREPKPRGSRTRGASPGEVPARLFVPWRYGNWLAERLRVRKW